LIIGLKVVEDSAKLIAFSLGEVLDHSLFH